jgi:cystathionine beta-lyase/cystathionine gamma-synthase
MSAPVVRTSLFSFPTFDGLLEGLGAEHRHSVYTRGRNPTVMAAERKLAALEHGEACLCFGSGMAAIAAVMLGLLEAGDHVLFVNHVYGPTLELAEHLRRFGVDHDVCVETDVAAVERALRPATRLLWLESPGTMLFRLADLPGIAALARDRGVPTCMDNSWATPLFQKPIDHGVDIVVHSASKYLGGHSDVMAGAVVSTAERMERIFYRAYLLNGGVLAPSEAWLLLRGLRTLPTRLRQHEEDGLRVAGFLRDHPAVGAVHHPAFAGRPTAEEAGLRGSTGLFSFELAEGGREAVTRVIDALERFRIGVSWGGTESLVISPHRPGNDAALAERGLPSGVIRLSVGLEGADALIEDLDAALGRFA